ncbi:hypothetical protein SAMN05216360_109190 [Methylobacterium phyllostachyos]|uniref:Uncharacterized protein n=1 Tax=Methylobacterium phyllostachyos TaxID=582672 RepID=A0A1H0CK70_9HYPH|nr:hypothetical protein SAMN05216360_109190 [Methylobacterium phyllostachyos]
MTPSRLRWAEPLVLPSFAPGWATVRQALSARCPCGSTAFDRPCPTSSRTEPDAAPTKTWHQPPSRDWISRDISRETSSSTRAEMCGAAGGYASREAARFRPETARAHRPRPALTYEGRNRVVRVPPTRCRRSLRHPRTHQPLANLIYVKITRHHRCHCKLTPARAYRLGGGQPSVPPRSARQPGAPVPIRERGEPRRGLRQPETEHCADEATSVRSRAGRSPSGRSGRRGDPRP